MLYRQPHGLARKHVLQNFRVLYNDRAVDDDIGNAGSRQRIFALVKRRVVPDSVRIEDRDVGIGADRLVRSLHTSFHERHLRRQLVFHDRPDLVLDL